MNPEAHPELEADLEARKAPARDHDHVVEQFLERIDAEIAQRVDERLTKRLSRRPPAPLNPVNLAICIPIVAVAGGIGKLPGLIVAFAALVVVFAAASARDRH